MTEQPRLRCPRCQGAWPIGPLLFGCPACAERGQRTGLEVVRQLGFGRVLCTTTGNHGVSLAAYAAAAGLECLVAVGHTIEPLAVRQMRLHGARVVEADRAWLPDDTVVCLATAGGTRWSATFEGLNGRPDRVSAAVHA